MKKVKDTCELCGKKYKPHHNPAFGTELCGPCEEDVLYYEELQEMQQSITQDMATDAGDPDLEGPPY